MKFKKDFEDLTKKDYLRLLRKSRDYDKLFEIRNDVVDTLRKGIFSLLDTKIKQIKQDSYVSLNCNNTSDSELIREFIIDELHDLREGYDRLVEIGVDLGLPSQDKGDN